MHVSFGDDRGANSIRVEGICKGKMHAGWDACLVEQAVGSNPNAAADQLDQEITGADRMQWVDTGPVAWVNESYAVSTAPSTGYCVLAVGVCR